MKLSMISRMIQTMAMLFAEAEAFKSTRFSLDLALEKVNEKETRRENSAFDSESEWKEKGNIWGDGGGESES